MKRAVLFGTLVILTLSVPAVGLAMGKKPATEATAVKTEKLALKCTKGGCPGGEGFCCLTDQRRLQSALQSVKGVSQVIPDKTAKTFAVVYPQGQVTLAALKEAASQAGFEVTEAKKLQ